MNTTTTRKDGRATDELRSVLFRTDFVKHAEGSVLIEMGETRVICTASIEDKVPQFLQRSGKGWITSEYGMLPRATTERNQREASRGKQGGRTMEIQRLIGRSLRAAIDPGLLGERTVWIDCDVIQADGGTRTASVTGGFVALALALAKLYTSNQLVSWPITSWIAAVSVGIVDGQPCLDLAYEEDSRAEVDMNVVATDKMNFIEVQGTAEGKSFSRDEMDAMLTLATSGLATLFEWQRALLAPIMVDVDRIAMERLTRKFR